MKSLGEVLKLSTTFLEQRTVLRPRLSAEILLAHLLKVKRLDLYMQFDRPLDDSELNAYRELIKRRAKGEPVEYILGEVDFYGCKLRVTSDVLIPRPETEILLDLACKQFRPEAGQKALDLCTGSGCLAIGLKKRFPQLTVFATDLSKQALEVAESNAKANQIEVHFAQGDLLEGVVGHKFDYILCNPPYLSAQEYQVLHREVSGFEPSMALIGGKSGYEFFERLRDALPPFLEEGAQLVFEIGASQGEAVIKIFNGPSWKEARVERDWAGQSRFLFFQN